MPFNMPQVNPNFQNAQVAGAAVQQPAAPDFTRYIDIWENLKMQINDLNQNKVIAISMASFCSWDPVGKGLIDAYAQRTLGNDVVYAFDEGQPNIIFLGTPQDFQVMGFGLRFTPGQLPTLVRQLPSPAGSEGQKTIQQMAARVAPRPLAPQAGNGKGKRKRKAPTEKKPSSKRAVVSADGNEPPKQKKGKKVVGRAPNKFILFRNFMYWKLQNVSKTLPSKAFSPIVGEVWKAMGVKGQQPFLDLQTVLDREHKARFPGYGYTPGSNEHLQALVKAEVARYNIEKNAVAGGSQFAQNNEVVLTDDAYQFDITGHNFLLPGMEGVAAGEASGSSSQAHDSPREGSEEYFLEILKTRYEEYQLYSHEETLKIQVVDAVQMAEVFNKARPEGAAEVMPNMLTGDRDLGDDVDMANDGDQDADHDMEGLDAPAMNNEQGQAAGSPAVPANWTQLPMPQTSPQLTMPAQSQQLLAPVQSPPRLSQEVPEFNHPPESTVVPELDPIPDSAAMPGLDPLPESATMPLEQDFSSYLAQQPDCPLEPMSDFDLDTFLAGLSGTPAAQAPGDQTIVGSPAVPVEAPQLTIPEQSPQLTMPDQSPQMSPEVSHESQSDFMDTLFDFNAAGSSMDEVSEPSPPVASPAPPPHPVAQAPVATPLVDTLPTAAPPVVRAPMAESPAAMPPVVENQVATPPTTTSPAAASPVATPIATVPPTYSPPVAMPQCPAAAPPVPHASPPPSSPPPTASSETSSEDPDVMNLEDDDDTSLFDGSVGSLEEDDLNIEEQVEDGDAEVEADRPAEQTPLDEDEQDSDIDIDDLEAALNEEAEAEKLAEQERAAEQAQGDSEPQPELTKEEKAEQARLTRNRKQREYRKNKKEKEAKEALEKKRKLEEDQQREAELARQRKEQEDLAIHGQVQSALEQGHASKDAVREWLVTGRITGDQVEALGYSHRDDDDESVISVED
ncbi:hypothetical protein F5X99DRAFT_408864 [Biscogniauxia marginata]|nr:hypothetical protein F5X99DRAFT_408864 [Biscogniauxia marginata]